MPMAATLNQECIEIMRKLEIIEMMNSLTFPKQGWPPALLAKAVPARLTVPVGLRRHARPAISDRI